MGIVTDSSFHSTSANDVVPEPERRPIYLRAYAEPPEVTAKTPKFLSRAKSEIGASDWVLVFDTETTTDESQRLRFGTFQLRKGSTLECKGIFFNPGAVSETEVDVMRRAASQHGAHLMTVAEFIESYFFNGALDVDGTIVGFNLPFDLSRLATGHHSALSVRKEDGTLDRSMAGGFTFKLSNRKDRPNLRIKHLSRRAAFINFTQPGKQVTPRNIRKKGNARRGERGFFLDLKTLAAALTSNSHSLQSLARFLGVAEKSDGGDYGRSIDAALIAYGLQDVEVTWQCYQALMARYDAHGLRSTPAHRIYSEASLGKAYLREMNVKPWREVQPDFDPVTIGAIMSSYFGGRAEVRTRRKIVRSLYCDFASMYPTICTLMGLWRFVISQGIDTVDASEEVRSLLNAIDLTALQNPVTWENLHVLVQIVPNKDILPVRAQYGQEPVATIGVNYLSADRPLWFTLADCIASKLLTGKSPRVIQALRFVPRQPQTDLHPFPIAGNSRFPINPAVDDFYKRVIDLRRETKSHFKVAKASPLPDRVEIERLESGQLALKILANATSYGVFIELNVEDTDDSTEPARIHGADGSSTSRTRKLEQPGKYFHPLLATLITGAARLMLAITEKQLFDHNLDWAFCDTDSMAFAMPEGMLSETFEEKVRAICDWFSCLNPYEGGGSILEFEVQNYGLGGGTVARRIEPLFCLAISAKRYALFNASDAPIIRKASAHGLGHLLPPYANDDAAEEDRETGVHLWQRDVWAAIIAAVRSDHPLKVALDWHPKLLGPAASRYAATGPNIISWFNSYNASLPYPRQVRPFNFLLWFHAKRPRDLATEILDFEYAPRMRQPKPVAPYCKDPALVIDRVIDRESGEAISPIWLRSYADVLRGYHTHPETKFIGGKATESGTLRRRHIFVGAINNIGKESDTWEEDEILGANEGSIVTYGLTHTDRTGIAELVRLTPVRQLKAKANVSAATIARVRANDLSVPDSTLIGIMEAARQLSAQAAVKSMETDGIVSSLKAQAASMGIAAVATRLSIDRSNLAKILAGTRKPSRNLMHRARSFLSSVGV